MLPGNVFGLILKNKMAARDVYSTLNKDFCWPSRAKGIIDLKFAGYVPEKQDGRHRCFFVSYEKCLYLPYYWF